MKLRVILVVGVCVSIFCALGAGAAFAQDCTARCGMQSGACHVRCGSSYACHQSCDTQYQNCLASCSPPPPCRVQWVLAYDSGYQNVITRYCNQNGCGSNGTKQCCSWGVNRVRRYDDVGCNTASRYECELSEMGICNATCSAIGQYKFCW